MEIWKDIPGYEGLYKVSNLGRIKSLGNGKTRKENILRLTKDKYGYLYITLSENGKLKKFKVHRLVAMAFIPNPNNYTQINHKDENRSNNRVENLEWCTQKYNNNYGNHSKNISNAIKGKYVGEKNPMYGIKGEKHPKSKKVKCITTGEIFGSISEATQKYNIHDQKYIKML